MSYSRDIYNSARAVLTSRRDKAVAEADARREEIFRRSPRVREITRELAGTSLQVSRLVLGGQNVQEHMASLSVRNLQLQSELKQLLMNLGYVPTALAPTFICPKCQDTGYLDGYMCDCLIQLQKQECYNRLNALSDMDLSDFDTFFLEYYSGEPTADGKPSPRQIMERNRNYCKNYADNFSRRSESILMYGETGLGKTHLSLAIGKKVIEKGYGVIYGSTHNIATQVNDEYFGRGGENLDSSASLVSCDLLILDDLGTEFVTQFVISTIYNIVNTRLMRGLPTIINTNLTYSEIGKIYSQRVVSRIMGSYKCLTFAGKDVRQIIRRNQGILNK